jgi:hypothetical protein
MWFTGSIQEAISRTKSENKLLLVFIEGEDDLSSGSRQSLESIQDRVLLRAVPIRLIAGSENAKFFSQIYPILVVPSCYIIAGKIAVEVVAGKIDAPDFLIKIDKAAEQLPAAAPAASSAAASPSTASLSPSVSQESGSETPPSVPSPAVAGPPPPSPASPAQPAVGDKLALAQRKLEELKARKEKEDEDREKELEQQRRETGKAVLSAKRKREEQEMIEAANERKRDAALEREHRAKVLAQIEQDKEERRKRFAQQNPDNSITSPVAAPAAAAAASSPQPVTQPISNADETKIQFRFPDGHTRTHVFKSADPLQAAHDFIVSSESLKSFSLSQMYPRKTFTAPDMSQSFSDLSLVPSSVLLVLMQSASSSYRTQQSASASSSSAVRVSTFWDYIPWFIAMPILTLWNFITSFLPSAAPPGQQNPVNSPSAAAAQSPPVRRFTAPDPEPQPSTSGIRRRDLPSRSGNIHRLHDDEDEDDEKKKTWNGNSTQQM